jgi:predicted DNA-binding transcriptional regulator AlpA
MNNLNVITTKEIAKMFHVSGATITRWIRKVPGFPTPRRLGQSFYFDADEIREFWDRQGDKCRQIYQP